MRISLHLAALALLAATTLPLPAHADDTPYKVGDIKVGDMVEADPSHINHWALCKVTKVNYAPPNALVDIDTYSVDCSSPNPDAAPQSYTVMADNGHVRHASAAALAKADAIAKDQADAEKARLDAAKNVAPEMDNKSSADAEAKTVDPKPSDAKVTDPKPDDITPADHAKNPDPKKDVPTQVTNKAPCPTDDEAKAVIQKDQEATDKHLDDKVVTTIAWESAVVKASPHTKHLYDTGIVTVCPVKVNFTVTSDHATHVEVTHFTNGIYEFYHDDFGAWKYLLDQQAPTIETDRAKSHYK